MTFIYNENRANTHKKVAIYVRTSAHNNAEIALHEQTMRVREYCKEKGLSVCDTVGVVGNRQQGFEALQKAIKHAQENGVEAVVMTTSNRLYAAPNELELVLKALDESGVELETMDGSHDAAKNSVTLHFIMNAGLDLESEDENE